MKAEHRSTAAPAKEQRSTQSTGKSLRKDAGISAASLRPDAGRGNRNEASGFRI